MQKKCLGCNLSKDRCNFSPSKDSGDGLRSRCKACRSASAVEWARRNPEKARAKFAVYYRANSESLKQAARDWYQKNADLSRERASAWGKNNRAQARATRAAWFARNPGLEGSYRAKRRAALLQATPAWANRFFIEEAYDLAQRRTKITGLLWHVDHVVPLRSKLVCGLHVEANLQVIPASVNLHKNNRYWPDMHGGLT